MFIFVLQSVWLYISELAGRDLDLVIILKFLAYVAPTLIPLILPLTILVASIMVFGSFAENYEFAAMKSTGISLQRAMKSLIVFILFLSITVFFFANNVIPAAQYKFVNLRRNIAKLKPSMAIAEGQFSQIGDAFNIKVSKKTGERGQFLEDVIIHKKNETKPNANLTVIVSKKGELISAEDSNTLSLALSEGYYYDEIILKDFKKQKRKPFVKSKFDTYTLNIDLTALNNKDVDKENKLSNQNMYNAKELVYEIDSLSKSFSKDIERFYTNMQARTGLNKFSHPKDSIKHTYLPLDTLFAKYSIKQQSQIATMAHNSIKSAIQTTKSKKKEFFSKARRLNKYEIALNEKFALAVACVILFFVGAPLGAIIRKGGLGLPMVVALLLFLTYHFIGVFAKNSAENGALHPFIATWLSTIIMLPLSIWLTYRATTDQSIFDLESFTQRILRLFGKKKDSNTTQ
jgi:lipopolysaccharide export system permease protein